MYKKGRNLFLSITLSAACFATSARTSVLVSTEAELNTAISNAAPGDTILMANGAWTDITIDFDANGLAGQPITLRAEVDGQVTIEGTSKLEIGGDYLVVKGLHFTNGSLTSGHVIAFRGSSNASDYANHSRLTECAITDYNPVDSTTNYKWVSIFGTHNRVDHCSFSGMNHIGVVLTVWLTNLETTPNETQIDNNLFANKAEGTGNGFETIRIGTSTRSQWDSNAIVENNYFYRCDGEVEIISNKSVGNIYRKNTFEECKGQLTLRQGAECLVERNFFLGNHVSGTSGVRVISRDHVVVNNYFENLGGSGNRAALTMMNGVPGDELNLYYQVEDALIAFNTFTGCNENFVFGLEHSSANTILPPLNCIIANNIVEGSNAPLIEYLSEPINMLYEGNLFYGAGLGITQPAGITIADPRLSMAPDGLMRPAANSPAIDAAVGNYSSYTSDMDGDTRLAGTQDVGADEVSITSPTYKPLTASDVGPRWMRPSTLSILSANFAVVNTQITFEDSTGLAPIYHLEQTDNLATDDWAMVESVIPVDYTSTTFNITDPITRGDSSFWRIAID